MKLINDNIRLFEQVSEREIHAYVDGQLDSRRHKQVEAFLTGNPEIAAEVEDYLLYNDLLKQAYRDTEDEPVPLRLLSLLNRPVRNVWPAVARVAAMVALCALSAGGGWYYAASQGKDGVTERFLQQIAMGPASYSNGGPVNTLEINMSGQIDPMNWLTQKVALEMQAPDLTQAGYSLESRQLVTRSAQEFVELTYRDAAGSELNLYMKTRWDKEPPALTFIQQDGVSIAHWQEGPLVYALAGVMDEDSAARIAELVRQGMIEKSSQSPQIQQNVGINGMPTLSPAGIPNISGQADGNGTGMMVDNAPQPIEATTENQSLPVY